MRHQRLRDRVPALGQQGKFFGHCRAALARCFELKMTHAELLRHALSQALRRVHVGPKKLKLDEETRWQIAGEAVEELRRYGGWKELDEEAPMRPLARS